MSSPSPATVFLTGASSGIGAATARMLVEHGHRVYATARRLDRLEALSASLPSEQQARLHVAAMDVTDIAAQQSAVADCVDRFGGIDVMVPNAGLGIFANLAEAELQDWHTMVDVNVNGVLTTLHICLPHLVEAQGLVIFIGSVASRNVCLQRIYRHLHAVLAMVEDRQDQGKVASTTICPAPWTPTSSSRPATPICSTSTARTSRRGCGRSSLPSMCCSRSSTGAKG